MRQRAEDWLSVQVTGQRTTDGEATAVLRTPEVPQVGDYISFENEADLKGTVYSRQWWQDEAGDLHIEVRLK